MLSMIQGWEGRVEVNGVEYPHISKITPQMLQDGHNGTICIKLYPIAEKGQDGAGRRLETTAADTPKQYKITVKAYMTKKAEPGFDFMAKWNNDNPMPLRTMTGVITQETRGMVRMKLHGVGEPVIRCMRCGKTLTNPISRHYGIGPDCMAHLGIVADIDDVESIKKQLVDVEWEGWVIRSAILEQEEV